MRNLEIPIHFSMTFHKNDYLCYCHCKHIHIAQCKHSETALSFFKQETISSLHFLQ